MVFVYIFIGLIIIIILFSLLMAKTYNIERSIVIKRSAEDVKNYVGDFNQYAAWNPWHQMEPGATKTISGTPQRPGHRYEWKGKKIGVGSLTLKQTDAKHIHIDLEFLKPWKAKAKDNWLFEPWGHNDETKVTWQNSGELPWPMARLMGPMIAKNLNHQFIIGLENLKNMCENN
jgi:hypothetical protein